MAAAWLLRKHDVAQALVALVKCHETVLSCHPETMLALHDNRSFHTALLLNAVLQFSSNSQSSVAVQLRLTVALNAIAFTSNPYQVAVLAL